MNLGQAEQFSQVERSQHAAHSFDLIENSPPTGTLCQSRDPMAQVALLGCSACCTWHRGLFVVALDECGRGGGGCAHSSSSLGIISSGPQLSSRSRVETSETSGALNWHIYVHIYRAEDATLTAQSKHLLGDLSHQIGMPKKRS